MILLRVQVEGFLSFRTATELDFRSERMTLLCGQNGSGKSSVFDAVLFGLFGHHRGGAQNHDRLINHHSDSARVEVEFRAADGGLWRATRTLRRRRTGSVEHSRQLFELLTDGSTVPSEGTHTQRGFDDKIRRLLGQTAETFTASVLLQQGQADRLLSNDAPKRFQVLEGLVRLEEFKRLHKRTDEERKSAQQDADRLSSQLQAVAVVGPEELANAEQKLASAEQRLTAAETAVEELTTRLPRAERWAEQRRQAAAERARLEPLRQLLERATEIESAAAELTELETVEPLLRGVLELNRQLAEQAERDRSDAAEHARLSAEVERAAHAAEAARQQADAVGQQLIQLRSERDRLTARRAELAVPLERWRTLRTQRDRLLSAEQRLAELGSDPAPQRAAAQREAVGWERIDAAVPTLRALARARARLVELRTAAIERAARLARVSAEADGWAERRPILAEAAAEAGRVRAAASEAVTIADTHCRQARRALDDLDGVAGQANCAACGQPLTAAHLAAERARRTADRERCSAESQTAKWALTEADAELTRAQAALSEAERGQREWAAERDRLRAESERADAEREQLLTEGRENWDRLPRELWEPLRATAAKSATPSPATMSASAELDWAGDPELTELLSAERLDTLRTTAAASLSAARRRDQQLAVAEKSWHEAAAEVAALRRAVREATPQSPSDDDAAHAEHELGELAERMVELAERINAAERREREARQAVDQHQRHAESAQRTRSDCDRRLAAAAATREHRHRELQRLRTRPELSDWSGRLDALTESDLAEPTARLRRLRTEDVAGRRRRLEQARTTIGVIEPRLAELDGQLAATPSEDRREPSEVRAELTAAQAQLRAARDARSTTAAARDALLARQDQRQTLDRQHRLSDRRRSLLKKLAELLGPRGLQRQLIADAERGIVSRANRLLDNLTRGELSIRLRTTVAETSSVAATGEAAGPGSADREGDGSAELSERALDLEAVHRPTGGGRPIGVAFLSGSQRFRVAVALALAIGELTAGAAAGTVLLDEGFGSLDAEGLDVMLRELQALRDSGRRVVVVSHQERFAESLPEGYRFRLSADGQTQIERLGRAGEVG